MVDTSQLKESLQKAKYDAIFVLGAEDIAVNETVTDILGRQKDPEDPITKVPVEVLMEGRGFADSLEGVEETGGQVHFVHEILAKKTLDILLDNSLQ